MIGSRLFAKSHEKKSNDKTNSQIEESVEFLCTIKIQNTGGGKLQIQELINHGLHCLPFPLHHKLFHF